MKKFCFHCEKYHFKASNPDFCRLRQESEYGVGCLDCEKRDPTRLKPAWGNFIRAKNYVGDYKRRQTTPHIIKRIGNKINSTNQQWGLWAIARGYKDEKSMWEDMRELKLSGPQIKELLNLKYNACYISQRISKILGPRGRW